jgi:N-acetylmuramoyl-L-alanine amidase
MSLIALDRQHAGVPSRAYADAGAWADLDRDGQRDGEESEALLTPVYILAAETRLRELGHSVVVLSDGQYPDRHARVNAYKADVYVAAHLNAGGGDYGLAVHDARSAAGKALAASVVRSLTAACPELRRGVVGDTVGFPRALACIDGVYSGRPVAVCYEPCFMDRQEHQGLLRPDGLVRLGRALADGIDAWLRARVA